MLGIIVGAGALDLLVAVMEHGEFPVCGKIILCVLAGVIPSAIINATLPLGLLFIGLAVGAVNAGFAIWAAHGMTVKRASIAAGSYLPLQVGISLAFEAMRGDCDCLLGEEGASYKGTGPMHVVQHSTARSRKALIMLIPLALLIVLSDGGAGESQPGVSVRPEPAAAVISDRVRLAEIAPSVKRGIFLVGHAGGGHGTAFLISRKHRLLATAAHVADHCFENEGMKAVPDGTATEYHVRRVWFHPGIVRRLDEGLYARSDDPKDGEIAFRVPDVAVIQLAEGGPELPEECELAGDPELETLAGREVGQLGYPGPLESGWPTTTRPASAVFATGSVRRTTDASENSNALPERRQWVWHTVPLSEGTSGSPFFLPTGHVVAIACAVQTGNNERSEAYRIDCLRELVAYHHLGDRALTKGERATRSDWGPDPRLPALRQAIGLVREAERLRKNGDYRASSQRCNEAITLVPEYAWAYFQRSKVYLDYCELNAKPLTAQERGRYAEWAREDASYCCEVLPWQAEPHVVNSQARIYLYEAFGNPASLRTNIAAIGALLSGNNREIENLDEHCRSFALNCRARSHDLLGNLDAAREGYDESIRLAPQEPRWLLTRAEYWKRRGRPEKAGDDLRRADQIRPAKSPPISHNP